MCKNVWNTPVFIPPKEVRAKEVKTNKQTNKFCSQNEVGERRRRWKGLGEKRTSTLRAGGQKALRSSSNEQKQAFMDSEAAYVGGSLATTLATTLLFISEAMG